MLLRLGCVMKSRKRQWLNRVASHIQQKKPHSSLKAAIGYLNCKDNAMFWCSGCELVDREQVGITGHCEMARSVLRFLLGQEEILSLCSYLSDLECPCEWLLHGTIAFSGVKSAQQLLKKGTCTLLCNMSCSLVHCMGSVVQFSPPRATWNE